jgi:hypothetical protein
VLRWLVSFVGFQLGPVVAAARREHRSRRRYLTRLLVRLPTAVYLSLLAAAKARFGRFPAIGGPTPKATVVLLSWRRAPNLNLLATLTTRAPYVERVIVSNNNPRVRIADHVVVRSPKLILIDQPKETQPGIRVPLALQYPGDLFIFLDDDVFPTPRQLTRLYAALVRQPEVPHGYVGLRHLPLSDTSAVFKHGDWDVEVQMLFRLYLCSRAVLERYVELAETLGVVHAEFGNGEDIILSFSGAGRPRIHAIGHVLCCATSDLPGVAISATAPEFIRERQRLTRRLLELRPDLRTVPGAEWRYDFLQPVFSLRVR